MLLVNAGAPISRSAMIALLSIKISMPDDALLLQHLIEGGIDPFKSNTMPPPTYASTIPNYCLDCRYKIGQIIVARAPPVAAEEAKARSNWPEDRVTNAWHAAVVTDISIGWQRTLCVRVRFLKFRGHYDE
jgi:hypothetical protein